MQKIKEIDKSVYDAAREWWKSIAKPLGSLGALEEIVSRIAAAQGTLKPNISKRRVLVMCADNGVTSEGVTQTDSSVTSLVAENITRETACVSLAARTAHADVTAVDVGMARDAAGTLKRKIRRGTGNILKERAMTCEEAEKAVQLGIDLAAESADEGYKILVAGEMGIGNTTTSAAVACVLLGISPETAAGRGAGLSDEGLKRKIEVIEKSILLHNPDKNDIIDVISKVGGLDIAAMTGVFIGGALRGLPVVIDGFISSVAALCAKRLCPSCGGYITASHVSNEGCAEEILNVLGLTAPIRAEMFPGEGTGGVMLLPLLDAAIEIFNEMPTFEDINLERYREYK